MVYPSKRDSWITLVLATAAMSMMSLASYHLSARSGASAAVAIGLLGCALFTIWVLHETHYEVGPSALVIHCGPLVKAIPVDAIHEIHPTRDPSSAPALSLDRLCVRYVAGGRHESVLISPRNRLAFLRNVAEQVPGLHLDGEYALHASHWAELSQARPVPA